MVDNHGYGMRGIFSIYRFLVLIAIISGELHERAGEMFDGITVSWASTFASTSVTRLVSTACNSYMTNCG